MSDRGAVWVEAYEQFLLRHDVVNEAKLSQLSDDEVSELYFQYTKEKGIEEAAEDWVHSYCMQWM